MNHDKRDEDWLLLEKYHGEKTEGFFADCKRLHSGEPLAYIIGHVPFLNTTIYLDSRPLIPRPETEYWVEKILFQITTHQHPYKGQTFVRVLDLCAGSGCIGVTILKALPSVHVDFAEIETIHHSTIIKNCEIAGIQPERYTLYSGDLFSKLPKKKYEYILANPPYIDQDRHTVDHAVASFEPHQALFGGKDGFEIIYRIIEKAPDYLSPYGILVLEHEPFQGEQIKDIGRKYGLETEIKRDQYGIDRYTLLTRSNATTGLE